MQTEWVSPPPSSLHPQHHPSTLNIISSGEQDPQALRELLSTVLCLFQLPESLLFISLPSPIFVFYRTQPDMLTVGS